MRILIVEDDCTTRVLMVMNSEVLFGQVEVVQATSKAKALEIISDKRFDFCFSDYNLPDGDCVELYRAFRKENPTSIFLLSSGHTVSLFAQFYEQIKVDSNALYIEKPVTLNALYNTLVQRFPDISLPDYYSVRSHFFLRFDRTLCDIYLRLSDLKYVKVFNRETSYSCDDILKYISKGTAYFYVHERDYKLFTDFYSKTPFLVRDPNPDKKVNDNWRRNMAVLHHLAVETGISENVIEQTKMLTDALMTEHVLKMGKANRHQFFDRLAGLASSQSYIFDHSVILSHIACAICSAMKWSTPQTLDKIIWASLMHDIVLDDSDQYFMLDTEQNGEQTLPSKVMAAYYFHPVDVSEQLKKISDIPADVDRIVFEHHEKPDGTGFPRKLRAETISVLGKVMIIAHDIVNKLYHANFDHKSYPIHFRELKKYFEHDSQFNELYLAFYNEFIVDN